MGGRTVHRPTAAPSNEAASGETPRIVLRAGDPPGLVVHRRGLEIAHGPIQEDRRRAHSRAVIADFHAVTRHGMRALCEMCATVDVVSEASSIGEAVRAVVESGADLVVIGFEPADHTVIRRIRHEAPFTKVLVMCPSSDEKDVLRAIEAGASGIVSKSASLDEFEAAIDTIRAGGMYLDGTATAAVRSMLDRTGSRRASKARLGDLTEREGEIARLVCEGLTARRIASRLGISDRTVNTHIGSLYRRLGVNNRVDAVRELMRLGIAPAPG